MSCDAIQLELCAYHFGTISEETRLELEAHLPTCANCTRAFVALKREIETAEHAERPSPAARARLRRAVAEELGLTPRRGWSWWERPLAFAFAAAAVLVAMVMVGLLATGPGAVPHGWSSSREPAAITR
ncbi:MAG: anti-sigma factor family protein [Acidobacteriota bacterium]